jgi:hypothetical protein
MTTLTKRIENLEQCSRRIGRIEDAILLVDGNLTEAKRLELESLDWAGFNNAMLKLTDSE